MRTAILVLLPFTLLACGDDEEVQQDTGPIVGVMELPVSLRTTDSQPAGAVVIEVSPTELRLDGTQIITLDRGNVPDAEKTETEIPKLKQALTSRPAAALRIHVNTPYETTALILSTLKSAGIGTVGFEVRRTGGTADTGWLVISDYRVEPKDNEPETFPGNQQRQWDELVQKWQEVYESCRRANYVDCAYTPTNPAPGGLMEIVLFARGSALKVEFTRFGMDEQDAEAEAATKRGPEMIEGVPTVGGGGGGMGGLQPGDEIPPPPVVTGAFTWRFEAAIDEGLSPISGAFRPICGQNPCGIVVTGDPDTMTMRLVTFLGAAFPNGTEAPHVLFEIPRGR